MHFCGDDCVSLGIFTYNFFFFFWRVSPSVCGSLSRSFEVLWSIWGFSGASGAFFKLLFGRFPQLSFTFVSHYFHICVSVSAVLWCRWCWRFLDGSMHCGMIAFVLLPAGKLTKKAIHPYTSTLQKKMNHVVFQQLLGYSWSLYAWHWYLKMLAHWNLKGEGCPSSKIVGSVKSLKPGCLLPNRPQRIRWAVWCWWVWYSLYSIYVSCDHYCSVGKKCNGLVSVSFSIQLVLFSRFSEKTISSPCRFWVFPLRWWVFRFLCHI